MIEVIFLVCLFYAFGSFCSLFFREMNPIIILFGLFVLGFFIQNFIGKEAHLYQEIAFLFGLVRHWWNPLTAFRRGIRYGSLRDVLHFFKLDMGRKKQAFERQQRQAEEALHKQREQMEREQADFRKEKDRFHRQKQQQDNRQSQQSRPSSLDPSYLADAYEILGVVQGASLKQCKTAYRSLMRIYHPDKRGNLAGSRKQEAEEQAVLINVAWDTVKKALG